MQHVQPWGYEIVLRVRILIRFTFVSNTGVVEGNATNSPIEWV